MSSMTWDTFNSLFNYSVDTANNGALTITGYKGTSNEVEIPDTVDGYPVVAFNSAAFRYNSTITKITIGSNITTIASGAFQFCTNLQEVVFRGKLESIEGGAFYKCSSLTSIEIPDSVTSIGIRAFQDCSSLTEITLPFVGATLNGTSNTHFGYIFGAFSYSDNDDYIPASLKKVTVLGGSIGSYAFYNCSGLTLVIISNSVTSIGDNAFYGCSGLTSIVIPDSVTSIGSFAFQNCTGLTEVNYLGSIDNWVQVSFLDGPPTANPLYYAKTLKIQGRIVEKVIISTAPSINQHAFVNSNITSITLGDSVTSIGDNAFYGCSKLASIIIPDSVTEIGAYAFMYCSGLTSIVIGSSVTEIGGYAFQWCNSLTSIEIPASVITMGSSVFNTSLNIFCRKSSKPTSWDNYWVSNANPKVYWYSNEDSPAGDTNYWKEEELPTITGWKISTEGKNFIESQNFTVSHDGRIDAREGKIANWNVTHDLLSVQSGGYYAGISAQSSESEVPVLWTGSDTQIPTIQSDDSNILTSTTPFVVTNQGTLIASRLIVNDGDILKATIGPITITGDKNNSYGELLLGDTGRFVIGSANAKLDIGEVFTEGLKNIKKVFIIDFAIENTNEDEYHGITFTIRLAGYNEPPQSGVTLFVALHHNKNGWLDSSYTVSGDYLISAGDFVQQGDYWVYTLEDGRIDWCSWNNSFIGLSIDSEEEAIQRAEEGKGGFGIKWKGNIGYHELTGDALKCLAYTSETMERVRNDVFLVTGAILPSEESFKNGVADIGMLARPWSNLYATKINGEIANLSTLSYSTGYGASSLIENSDRNKKCNILLLSDTWSHFFDRLQPVTFQFSHGSSQRTHMGLIAQDVKSAILEVGLTTQDVAAYCEWEGKDGLMECGLRYGEFIALCIDQIQKLKKEVVSLKEELAELKSKQEE